MKNKTYYIQKYNDLVSEATRDAENNGYDVTETICEYEADANADEVVGYYLTFYKADALSKWKENISFKTQKTEQDEVVTEILKQLFR